jgi:predicted dehydrogenase
LKPIKVGVIGTGHLGRYHAQKYAGLSDVELVGVTDLNQEKAHSVAQEVGCQALESLDLLLPLVNAVSVATPTDTHFDIGMRVLGEGKHCMIEKPISQTIKESDELIALAKEQNLILQIGHIERFNPAMLALHDMDLEPRFVESHRLSLFNPRGTEVAVVLDLMIHDIDIILNLVQSPVIHVDASGVAVVSDSIDIANARIRFQNGCVANLTASRISQKKMRKLRLFQKDTYVSVDFLEKKSEVYRLVKGNESRGLMLGEIGVGDKKRNIVYQSPPVPDQDGLETELSAFIRSIRGDKVKAVSGEEAKTALSVAIQILEQIGE